MNWDPVFLCACVCAQTQRNNFSLASLSVFYCNLSFFFSPPFHLVENCLSRDPAYWFAIRDQHSRKYIFEHSQLVLNSAVGMSEGPLTRPCYTGVTWYSFCQLGTLISPQNKEDHRILAKSRKFSFTAVDLVHHSGSQTVI